MSFDIQNPIIEPRTTNHEPRKAVCFVTLGCKVNQTESEAMAQLFREAEYQVVSSQEEADVVVVNTCTVTNTGDSKSRQIIRRMIKAHPDSVMVVMGCYAQTAPGEILGIEGVDLVLGTQDRSKILEWIERVKAEKAPQNAVRGIWDAEEFEELPQLSEEHRTRAMLKIQEGCNQFCTYCIIPYARGPLRSRRPENAIAEARRLVEEGYPEIVLTGIHTGFYGQDLGDEWNLARLIGELDKIPGLRRLRLSSIEPMEYTDDLIESIVLSEKVCPHVHIPLQSGSDNVLARMNRPYNLKEYRELLEKLRQRIPGLAVTTDIIVGFPGETDEDHESTIRFAESCDFSGIHVFPYSKRKGTPAADYPDQVLKKLKDQRVKELLVVARDSQLRFSRRFIGDSVEVLIERVDPQGCGVGHTPHYIQVEIPSPENGKGWSAGEFVTLVLKENNIKLS
ncbi:tRNA (N(6)-L-threonylcarbamoyladenosine(37)-C(2))-methylthiotransferase MtaB [Desulfosporosinus sp.]|uniref:tRNA (N(6)-L-threonylcarbamoyladenosine(37)-C(2))- methylthiotransferase MtaB n=1 Tax=Desulfosporosinus sp. TaxID=157907 RepID=UPI0025C07A1C|nr:tRNA (N(6)-L-threonylcarbamoyladenosine(37)-C(2))-methylthiotransferase MtaB [Desulfosporosinus sp.]MBC2721062.1 tRNA (N(6)-L-threonylcarbamoyladenosine(37)-C(2))-methylthiotransferase MtaB [Desulfosporosinus sp.]MBC2725616.1 tRNA (N(6)-L-threonylcarbamoyladenosine(37)-C(2))-methylthiotransferase MtaB [Desulfosporosinus sp.]